MVPHCPAPGGGGVEHEIASANGFCPVVIDRASAKGGVIGLEVGVFGIELSAIENRPAVRGAVVVEVALVEDQRASRLVGDRAAGV